MKIGLAGLGRMGGIFADRLLEAGFDLSLWNRSREKAIALADRGAGWCESPAALATSSDIVLTSMANAAALEAVFSGPDGFLSAPLDGKLLVDTSTVAPDLIRSLSDRVAAAGGVLVDAPILGTVGPARQGKIVFLVGGPAEATERARPVFDVLGRKVIPMGAVGSGMTMKLVVNLHLATYWYSVAEAMAMGTKSGIGLETLIAVLEDSPVATAALAGKKDILLGRSNDIGFDMRGVAKDLMTALDLARTNRSDARTGMQALEGFNLAIEEGFGDDDVAAIVEAVAKRKAGNPSVE